MPLPRRPLAPSPKMASLPSPALTSRVADLLTVTCAIVIPLPSPPPGPPSMPVPRRTMPHAPSAIDAGEGAGSEPGDAKSVHTSYCPHAIYIPCVQRRVATPLQPPSPLCPLPYRRSDPLPLLADSNSHGHCTLNPAACLTSFVAAQTTCRLLTRSKRGGLISTHHCHHLFGCLSAYSRYGTVERGGKGPCRCRPRSQPATR